MKMHTEHPKNMMTVLSNCCNAKTSTVPACFGEPTMSFCNCCNTQCELVWKPMYENVAKGTYRKIEYPITPKKDNEDADNQGTV